MLVVGLTGGIASGKSLVLRVFHGLGARTIDADQIVRELLEPGQPAWEEVARHFGKDIQLPDTCIDRRKLGDIVFQDPEKRAWLNKCLHPRVFEAYHARIRRLGSREPDAIVVFDAALLIETGFHTHMDKLVVVYCEPEQQLARLMQRDSMDRNDALSRIKSQMPLAEKRQYADFIIENTETKEDTERQVRAVFDRLKAIAGSTE